MCVCVFGLINFMCLCIHCSHNLLFYFILHIYTALVRTLSKPNPAVALQNELCLLPVLVETKHESDIPTSSWIDVDETKYKALLVELSGMFC